MKRLQETTHHRQSSNEMLARFLPILGMETSLTEVSSATSIPKSALIRWSGRATALPEKYYAAIERWMMEQAAVK